MNNIQEKDWAEDDWHSHTGIDSSCDYCAADDQGGTAETDQAGQGVCGSGGDGEPLAPAARS